MAVYRELSGVNREIKEQHRGLGGTNRQVKEQYRGLGGVNRKVFNFNTGNDEFTKLLLHFDGDLVDASKTGATVSMASGTAVYTAGKFGQAYSSADRYMRIANQEVCRIDEDYTIDFWIYPTSLRDSDSTIWSYQNYIVHWETYDGVDANIGMTSRGFQSGLTASASVSRFNYNFSLNTWYHIAIVRANDIEKVYINGVLQKSYTSPHGVRQFSAMQIGRRSSYGYPFYGLIDEFRISNTVRWTEDFAPPTNPYS